MRLPAFAAPLAHFWQREIWRPDLLDDRSWRGLSYAGLRVISLTVTGLVETKSPSRAAALSFSSLLSLGPLVAIAILLAGSVFDRDDPELAVKTLNHFIKHVAPQVVLYEISNPAAPLAGPTAAPPAAPAGDSNPGTPPLTAVPVNPAMVRLINGFVAGSRSGAVGTLGGISLLLIVLQAFTSVENAFNEIWGVRSGRSWPRRIFVYGSVFTLGSLLFFAAVIALAAHAIDGDLASRLRLAPAGRLLMPVATLLTLVAILALFYRHIPNTLVRWRAAFSGAVVVALLLLLNNWLAWVYLSRVRLQASLYGSLSLVPILMFGMYVFWLILLIGGQVSYAVQNVRVRNSQAAWAGLGEATQERLSLVVFLTVCRRFQAGLPPCTASHLEALIKVPTQILNECLNRLGRMRLVNALPPASAQDGADHRFEPARPLAAITLGEFKRLDKNLGDDPLPIPKRDAVLQAYDEATGRLLADDFFQRPLDRLLADFPGERPV